MRNALLLPLLFCAALAAAQPAGAGPPFRTDDPEPVEYGHWEFYTPFSTATHVAGETAGVLAGVEANYGAAPDLQLHAVLPLAFDKPAGGMRVGYGDTELGVKYRFVQEDEKGWRPMVGVFPLLEAPTGNPHRGLGTGNVHAFLPVWIQKSFGQWTTYGGGGYWINPGLGNRNYWFAGWLLQRKVTDQLTLGGELFHQTADTVGGRDSTGFNLGGIYDFSENYHLLFSAGRGLEHAATTNQFSYYLALLCTF